MYQVNDWAHVGPIVEYAADCIHMMVSIYEECSFFIFALANVSVDDDSLEFEVFPMLVDEVLVHVFSMFVKGCLVWSKVKLDHINISSMLNFTKK
jgi:hypothetical protein